MEVKANRVEGFEQCKNPGDFFWVAQGRMMFCCPCGCGCYPGIVVKPDYPNGWEFDGNLDCPTVAPSIDINKGHWHGYLQQGIFRSCS